MHHMRSLYLLLILALFGLGSVLAWAAVRFATPQPEYVEIGRLSDFPPSAEPYVVQDPLHVFVLRYNDQLVVLDPLNRVPGGYNVAWNTREQVFIDPSRGSLFDRYGNPTRRPGIKGPIEKQSLSRYPVSVRGDRIWIDVSGPAIDIR
jgi:nitrite reductase/ring-hydroxylating ferredoxin subunit